MEVIDRRKDGVVDKIKAHPLYRKLKGIKNLQLILAVFIIAVALLIYSGVSANRNVASEGVNADADVMDEEERRLASALAGIEGVGRVETMITRKNDEVVGVLVIAEGAEDISVMLRLLSATTTAMGVNKSVVNIYAMK